MRNFKIFEKDIKNNSGLLQQTEKDLVYLPGAINKAKEEENDSFRKWQEDLLTNPNRSEESYKDYESKKRQREKLEDKQRALEEIKPRLKASIFESENLVNEKKEEKGVTEGGEIVKGIHDLFPIFIDYLKRASVDIDLFENSRRNKPKKHYMGMATVKVKKGSRLEGIYAYNPPVEVRTRADEPVNVHLETQREDKPVFVSMAVESALELERDGEIEIVDDLEKLPFELEPRFSPLPEIYDVLSSLKLYLIPGNGLPPELQEYAEKGIPLTVFDVGRLMSEEEKQSILKKILDEA
jgi:hypothetical protein